MIRNRWSALHLPADFLELREWESQTRCNVFVSVLQKMFNDDTDTGLTVLGLALLSRSQLKQKCFGERRTASFPQCCLQEVLLVVGPYHYTSRWKTLLCDATGLFLTGYVHICIFLSWISANEGIFHIHHCDKWIIIQVISTLYHELPEKVKEQ